MYYMNTSFSGISIQLNFISLHFNEKYIQKEKKIKERRRVLRLSEIVKVIGLLRKQSEDFSFSIEKHSV